ncbi:MAG TPA: extracellular solute-binding protein [Tepidisphaeraceae bacterium]|nr:extracellular solute-binding protein [Tepidisphaeraceae bacterium]
MKYVKQAVVWLMVLAAVVLLALPGKQRQSLPPGRVQVRYWEKWTGREAEQMKQIVDEFNATVGAEKGIWVSYISMSSVDQKTLISTAAGVPPDIAGLWDNQAMQFAAMDALEPLDALAEEYRRQHPELGADFLTRDYFKHVYYDGCTYEGVLYALPSTPSAVALHYNKKIFQDKAAQLRAAGLDPDRPPRSIQELDRYAQVLDTWEGQPGKSRLLSAGYLPQEPGWWITLTPYWFGAELYDPATRKLTFTDPKVIQAFEWIAGYSKRLGVETMRQFRASYPQGFDSPQSPFFTGTVVMEQEGPWKANYIEKLNPRMNNWRNLPPEQLRKLTRQQRRENCMWGAAPFPSTQPIGPDTTDMIAYCGMDIVCIPRTSRHKREAFEFLAFLNRQEVMERLVSMHCKNSPLRKMSAQYIENHPNPYIEVFETMASSPNARGLPKVPIWPEIAAELSVAAEKVYLLQATPQQALQQAQHRGQLQVDRFFQRQALRTGG